MTDSQQRWAESPICEECKRKDSRNKWFCFSCFDKYKGDPLTRIAFDTIKSSLPNPKIREAEQAVIEAAWDHRNCPPDSPSIASTQLNLFKALDRLRKK